MEQQRKSMILVGGGSICSWSRRREGGVIIRIWMGYIDHIVYVGLVVYLPSDWYADGDELVTPPSLIIQHLKAYCNLPRTRFSHKWNSEMIESSNCVEVVVAIRELKGDIIPQCTLAFSHKQYCNGNVTTLGAHTVQPYSDQMRDLIKWANRTINYQLRVCCLCGNWICRLHFKQICLLRLYIHILI